MFLLSVLAVIVFGVLAMVVILTISGLIGPLVSVLRCFSTHLGVEMTHSLGNPLMQPGPRSHWPGKHSAFQMLFCRRPRSAFSGELASAGSLLVNSLSQQQRSDGGPGVLVLVRFEIERRRRRGRS